MIFKLIQMTNGKIQIELARYTGTNKTKKQNNHYSLRHKY